MNETKVVDTVEEWLRGQYAFVLKEFPIADGRLDLIAARWQDDYQLRVVGVELQRL